MLRFPLGELLGFTYEHRDNAWEVIFQPKPEHYNPLGTLHGGVFCDLADAAMGLTFHDRLAEGESFTTLEFKINFLKPIWTSPLRAVARVVKAGRTIAMMECDVFDDKGSLAARAGSTIMILRGDAAKGR